MILEHIIRSNTIYLRRPCGGNLDKQPQQVKDKRHYYWLKGKHKIQSPPLSHLIHIYFKCLSLKVIYHVSGTITLSPSPLKII